MFSGVYVLPIGFGVWFNMFEGCELVCSLVFMYSPQALVEFNMFEGQTYTHKFPPQRKIPVASLKHAFGQR